MTGSCGAWALLPLLALAKISGAAELPQFIELSELPPLPIAEPAHVSEIEVVWECGTLLLMPEVPAGWEVSIVYGNSEGSLRVYHTASVIEIADFHTVAEGAATLPRARLSAESGCFSVEVTVTEGKEGTGIGGCGTGVWIFRSSSLEWTQPECIIDPPPRN